MLYKTNERRTVLRKKMIMTYGGDVALVANSGSTYRSGIKGLSGIRSVLYERKICDT